MEGNCLVLQYSNPKVKVLIPELLKILLSEFVTESGMIISVRF